MHTVTVATSPATGSERGRAKGLGAKDALTRTKAYHPYHDQTPKDPYASLALLRHTPLLEKLALVNGPDVQAALLRDMFSHKGSVSAQDTGTLHEIRTRIVLKLTPLKSSEALTHDITVTLT
jgi:hypothetical protein